MCWKNYAIQVHDGEKLLPRRVIHQEFHHDAMRVYCEHYGIEEPHRIGPGRWPFDEDPYIVEHCETDEDADLE
jgi:hypothetical protein